MSNNELKELFLKSKNFSFKLENYFDAYHENFKEFRNKEITFVEIGIFQGGSLEIWKKYFGDKARIIGIDINPECKKFEDDQYVYILKAIEYFNKRISNPKFFLFSDNFTKIENKLKNFNNIIFVKNFLSNKTLEDFFLMIKCKNYAVGPTTFHWWSAWLNNNPDKICVRPHNLNPSNNIDFWPESWDIIK